ncbi:MAG: hypothetical protein M0R16_08965 [Bacteroidales bacterium]|jgi:uncharacterized protein YbcC (UPF0753/DUF2309 family)|nr:hypothetical protein [Bacteroidales bacterium]
MGLRKGTTNNPAGRPAGTPNKLNADLQQRIADFLNDNFDEVISDWHKLENKREKINFFRDLIKYKLPTLQATEFRTDFDKMTDEQLDHIINELKKNGNDEKSR